MSARHLVQRLERRAFFAHFLEAFATTVLVAALVFAPLVLLARWEGWLAGTPWLLALIPPACGLVRGWAVARRERLAPGVALVWLDRRLGGEGVLLTADERPDSRWDARVSELLNEAGKSEALRLPRARTDRPALLGAGALALVVIAVGAKLPEPWVPSADLFGNWIERLSDRIGALDELNLDPALVERLSERLESLAERVDESQAESMYEALDRLGEQLDREAQKLAASKGRLDAELERALQAAQQALEGSSESSQAALESLSAALVEAKASGLLSPAGLSALEAKLSKLERGQFDALAAGAMGAELLQRVEQRFGEIASSGAFKPGRLAELAEEFGNGQPGVGAGTPGATPGPGTGGVSRGPGHASLEFTGETNEQQERFSERFLPAARVMDLEHSELRSKGEAFPEVAPELSAADSGRTGASAGAGAWRRRVAPRHRRAVRRFFEPKSGNR